ncbi:hypothetical protein [uncultured Mediterranean phage]|nr:hypothetical protein [uncultured Mediterranean phage]
MAFHIWSSMAPIPVKALGFWSGDAHSEIPNLTTFSAAANAGPRSGLAASIPSPTACIANPVEKRSKLGTCCNGPLSSISLALASSEKAGITPIPASCIPLAPAASSSPAGLMVCKRPVGSGPALSLVIRVSKFSGESASALGSTRFKSVCWFSRVKLPKSLC